MSYRGFVSSAVVTAIVVGTLISCSVADQASETAQSAPAAWTPPRTPWGEPDLQGVWRYESDTPLERPASLAGRTERTDQEVAEQQEVEDERAEKRLAGADYQQLNRLPRGDDGQPTASDPRATIAGAEYNAFWQDRARARQVDSRTALIVDPPDGRMPVRDELKRQDIRGWQIVGSNPPADFKNNSWLDRDTGERCLTDGVPGEMWGGTGPNLFVQSPGYVVIIHEQFRDRRIITTDGRPHGNIPHWLGDARGHWEDNTLVVETTNFIDRPNYAWRPPNTWKRPASTMHLVERWTRVADDTIEYTMTITDPSKFTRPWSVELQVTDLGEMFLEYACHEGNYGMIHALSAERNLEKANDDPPTTR